MAGPDSRGTAAVNATSVPPALSGFKVATAPATTGSVDVTTTPAAAPLSSAPRSTLTTPPAGTSTTSMPVGVYEPSAVTSFTEAVASTPPGAAITSRRLPSPPGMPGTVWLRAALSARGTKSTPSGIEPFCWSNRSAGTTRPAVAVTSAAAFVSPGATLSRRTASCVRGATVKPCSVSVSGGEVSP